MAVVESLKKSTINIESISKSLSSTKKTVLSTSNSVDNISKIISNNTRVKRELFARSEVLDSRRKEASKRQEIEDQIESSRVSSQPSRGLSFVGKSDKSPLGRILGFLGFTFAGWIVENLPTWIFMGKEFISRIQSFGRSMYDMVDNMKLIIESFGSVLKNSFDSIVRLDFNEFSEGSVTQSFDELTSAIQGLGNEITETFKLFTTPLTESVETGEQAPGLAEDRPETMFPSPTEGGTGGGENQTKASYGTKEQRAMLDAIAWAEGGVSYRTMFGGGQFDTSKGWKHPDKVIRSGGYASAAAGRYQFMPFTWERAAKALGLKDFSPINQDKAAIWLMDKRLGGNSADILKKEGVSNRVLNAFAGEWAAVPVAGGGSFYGQPSRKVKDFRDKYQSLLKTTPEQVPSTPSTQQPRSIPSQTSLPPLPRTNTLANQYYGAPRDGGKRKHAGVDFDISGPNAKFYSRIGGVVVGSPFRFGEDGWATDIYNKELGVYERIAEAARILVKPGQVLKPGDLVAQGESRTGVIHYEIRTKIEGGFQNSLDPIAFLRSPKVQSQSQSSIASAATPSSQISPTPPSSALPSAQISPIPPSSTPGSNITPERKGSQILVIDDSQPQAPQVSYPSSQPQSAAPEISEFKLLNNFIKNKLLLDLAYL